MAALVAHTDAVLLPLQDFMVGATEEERDACMAILNESSYGQANALNISVKIIEGRYYAQRNLPLVVHGRLIAQSK